ncbi:MAG: hypothetical protein V2B15_20085 [Bacteroidota bacterium]
MEKFITHKQYTNALLTVEELIDKVEDIDDKNKDLAKLNIDSDIIIQR